MVSTRHRSVGRSEMPVRFFLLNLWEEPNSDGFEPRGGAFFIARKRKGWWLPMPRWLWSRWWGCFFYIDLIKTLPIVMTFYHIFPMWHFYTAFVLGSKCSFLSRDRPLMPRIPALRNKHHHCKRERERMGENERVWKSERKREIEIVRKKVRISEREWERDRGNERYSKRNKIKK